MSKSDSIVGLIAISFVIIVVILLFIGYPIYNVWSSEQHGKAELARGEYNRQLAVVEAKAKLDSARSLADAEIVRAQGVAKANEIIGKSLENNSEYLDYLWITEKIGTDADKEVVYVPTEAQLPILEAGRFKVSREVSN